MNCFKKLANKEVRSSKNGQPSTLGTEVGFWLNIILIAPFALFDWWVLSRFRKDEEEV